MPLVALPSGALAPLETPGLFPMLSGGGGTLSLARAAFAHDEIDANSLSEEDCYAVALWGILAFTNAEEAATLGAVCEAFREPPSWRMCVADRVLAWKLDLGCLLALKAARRDAQEAPEESPEGALVFGVPDPWTGDDDD